MGLHEEGFIIKETKQITTYPKISIAIGIFSLGFALLTFGFFFITFISSPPLDILIIMIICGYIIISFILFFISKQKYYEKRFLLMGGLSTFIGGFLVYTYYYVLSMEEIENKIRELEEESPYLEETYNKFFLENVEIIKIVILISAVVFLFVGSFLIIYHFWRKAKEVRFSIQSDKDLINEDLIEKSPENID